MALKPKIFYAVFILQDAVNTFSILIIVLVCDGRESLNKMMNAMRWVEA